MSNHPDYTQHQQYANGGSVSLHASHPGLTLGAPGLTGGPPPPQPSPATPLAPPLPPGPIFYTMPIVPTTLRMSARRDVAQLPLTFTVAFQELSVNTETTSTIQFSFPTRLGIRNGSGYRTDGAGNPAAFVTGTTALNWCLVQFNYNSAQFIDTAPTLADTILGTAQRPGHFGAFGWTMLGNTFLQIKFTPLLANLNFYITVQGVQIMPGMDAWGSAGREADMIPEVNAAENAARAAEQALRLQMQGVQINRMG